MATEPTLPARAGRASWTRLVRIWLVLMFSYVLIKLALDLALFGWIDVRGAVLWELVVLPVGQSLVLWLITRGRDRRLSSRAGAGYS